MVHSGNRLAMFAMKLSPERATPVSSINARRREGGSPVLDYTTHTIDMSVSTSAAVKFFPGWVLMS